MYYMVQFDRPGASLQDQGVRNNSVVMIMVSSENGEGTSTSKQNVNESGSMSRTRNAASVLANKKRGKIHEV